MLFVSTPSLAISLVLAVFYAANLVFYVINSEQNTDNLIETETVIHKNPQSVLLTVLQGTPDVLEHSCSADLSRHAPILHSPFSILRYFLTFSVLHSEICWKCFSRPPPVG